MSKSKKKESKKESKDLSIPPLPDPIFVVEIDSHVLITGFSANECVFPCYRFDNNPEGARDAADAIGIAKKKLVVDAVNYYIDDPLIYDPIVLEERSKRLMEIINQERALVREGIKNEYKNPLP